MAHLQWHCKKKVQSGCIWHNAYILHQILVEGNFHTKYVPTGLLFEAWRAPVDALLHMSVSWECAVVIVLVVNIVPRHALGRSLEETCCLKSRRKHQKQWHA
jgi:hypothetical protein